MVERPRQRYYTAKTHATVRGLESDYPAVGSWNANGASGVGAQRAEAKIGGDRGGRTARGSSRDVIERPRIVYSAEIGDVGGPAVRELMEIELAENHRACIFESADHF